MLGIRIERIDAVAALEEIKSVWNDYERADAGATIFQSWAWNSIWCKEVLARKARARLAVRVAQDGAGRILAIFPLFDRSLIGSAIQLTQFIGHRMSSVGGMLSIDPTNHELTALVVAALFKDLNSRTIMHLSHMNGQASLTRHLIGGGLAKRQCPHVWLEADDQRLDPALRLGSKMRKNLRSIRNRMRREFKTEFKVVSGQDFPAAFDEFADLHRRRFAFKGKASSLVGPELAFFKAATSELSNSGHCEILQLRADGETIAAQLMISDRQRYYAIQAGFAPEFSRFSPAFLLDLEAIRRGFNELGCRVYDFGAGYEAYKYHWNPIIGSSYFCCAGALNLYARSMASVYRLAFRQALPRIPSELARERG
jgi:CelD/BcsL family acetyltransferase involved in cellulose biosynthesis